jgi:hypothetical protein
VCEFLEAPLVKYGSSYDQTNLDLGVKCTRVEQPLPGTGFRSWKSWWDIASNLEQIP